MNKAIARQEAVERQTRNVDELGKRALNKLIKEREAPKIAKQLEAIGELKRRVAQVDKMHYTKTTPKRLSRFEMPLVTCERRSRRRIWGRRFHCQSL